MLKDVSVISAYSYYRETWKEINSLRITDVMYRFGSDSPFKA